MLLDGSKIPELYRLLQTDGKTVWERIRAAEVSLTAALFLAITHQQELHAERQETAGAIAKLELFGVSSAIRCLANPRKEPSADPFGAPRFELYRIGSRDDLVSEEWPLFYDRFRRSATKGRRSHMFRAVGGVLGEMGDNVVAHAYGSSCTPCMAIAGFHVTETAACFCVADSGQGFLRSLQKNARWSGLSSDREALEAVINKHATSREGEEDGGGFKQLFNLLLDFNGLVIIRSGGCMCHLVNDGPVRRSTMRSSASIAGSSVTVIISQTEEPKELPLNFSA